MTKDEINELPIRRYEGRIQIIRSKAALQAALREIQAERLLGFDTETKPSFRRGESHPVALMQLATADCVYLVMLTELGVPPELVSLLQNPDIVKAGVGLADDMQKLHERVDFTPRGFVDLSDSAKAHGIKNHGLRGLTAVLLKFRISKQAQRSNWGRIRLSDAQVKYAATDAWVSREIHLAFERMKREGGAAGD